jgi:alginate O-acetyltransferase complex protein AlgJ
MTIIRSKTFIQVALTFIFLTVLLIFSSSTILSSKKDISLQEKRQLAQFPHFSWTMYSMANWLKSLDIYLKDHFFYRERLVFLNALLRVKLFHRSPTFVVLAGKEGWYFFMGDWALHDYLGNFDKNVDALRSWEKLITLRQQRMQNVGGNYLVAVAPNKESVYPEYLPGRFEGKAGTTMLDALKKQMRESPMADHFLDLGEPLQMAKTTGQIYYKTDSHWNDRGAHFAYSAIIERIKLWYPEVISLPETRFKKRFQLLPFRGDLVSLMGLSGVISEPRENWKIQTRCAEQMDGDISSEMLPAGKLLKANGCPAGAALRVLVISDSFGEGPLREYLSETFQEVVYSRELSFPDLQSYIAQYQPDLVLDLRVGRYIPKVMSPGPDEKITD